MATKKQKKKKLKEQRVLIVGGGIAGLEAARQLQEIMELSASPLHVTLLEHKSRLGGRVHTMRTSPSTFYEAGASRIASTHSRVNDLVNLFHLNLFIIIHPSIILSNNYSKHLKKSEINSYKHMTLK